MRKMKAAELVLDFEIYPRNNIDPHNVKSLVEALAAGAELPPVIIDRASKRVVDGFHRVKAHLRQLGDDAEIEVIEKRYKSDAELFLDAARYNAAHGAKLDPCDRTRCIIISQRLGIDDDAIASALHVPIERVIELRVDRTATTQGGLTVPLKNTVRKGFHGRTLTKRQEQANERLSGMNQQFYANQLIELIEAKMLDLSDDSLIERLRHLHGLLDGVLAAR
jgi:hypothetical protein